MSVILFVMEERCDTCIFRPGNLMDLNKGRLADLIESTDEGDTNVICHKSRSVSGAIHTDAWCKGSVDRRPGKAVRTLREMGLGEEISTDGKTVRGR